MSLYDFAKGLVLEAGNKVRIMMKEKLNIETKSNPNDLVTNVDKATEIIYMMRLPIVIQNIVLLGKKDMVMI